MGKWDGLIFPDYLVAFFLRSTFTFFGSVSTALGRLIPSIPSSKAALIFLASTVEGRPIERKKLP